VAFEVVTLKFPSSIFEGDINSILPLSEESWNELMLITPLLVLRLRLIFESTTLRILIVEVRFGDKFGTIVPPPISVWTDSIFTSDNVDISESGRGTSPEEEVVPPPLHPTNKLNSNILTNVTIKFFISHPFT
jgi:hypothetical protein